MLGLEESGGSEGQPPLRHDWFCWVHRGKFAALHGEGVTSDVGPSKIANADCSVR